MTLKHPMPTIRHNPQRSTINHNKLTNYPPQCIPHTYGCTIANITCQNNGARVSYGLYAGEREGRAHEKNEGESEQSEVMAK